MDIAFFSLFKEYSAPQGPEDILPCSLNQKTMNHYCFSFHIKMFKLRITFCLWCVVGIQFYFSLVWIFNGLSNTS